MCPVSPWTQGKLSQQWLDLDLGEAEDSCFDSREVWGSESRSGGDMSSKLSYSSNSE